MSFAGIATPSYGGDILVLEQLKSLLPNVGWTGVTCEIDVMPGLNHPLQKYLYLKVRDRPRTLIASFRYFDELDDNEVMLAKVMLLVG